MKERDQESPDYWLNMIFESLSGEISPELRQRLDTWLQEADTNRAFYDRAVVLWDALPLADHEQHAFDTHAAFTAFQRKVLAEPEVMPRQPWRRISPWRYAVAASLLVGSTLLAGYWSWGSHQPLSAVVKVVAENGTKSHTVLSDGSIVWLNAGSSLEISEEFGKNARNVRLMGEAFFQVAKDSKRPFTVATKALDVRVLGTSFNVSCYPENPATVVSLVDGQVEILPAGKENAYRMTPGQSATYLATTDEFSIGDNISEEIMAWRADKYIFKNKPFREIVSDLQRIYGVEIAIGSTALLERRFTGDFVRGEDIREVMDILASFGTFTYHMKGKQITITE